jgi:hypothetical protein
MTWYLDYRLIATPEQDARVVDGMTKKVNLRLSRHGAYY